MATKATRRLPKRRREVHKTAVSVSLSPDDLNLLAHELRTPLNALCAYAELLDCTGSSADETTRRRWLDGLKEAADRLKILIDDLDTAAGDSTGPWRARREATDVGAAARRAGLLMASRLHENRLILDIEEGPVSAMADPRALDQILAALLDNAVKAAPADSRVSLKVSRDQDAVVIETQNAISTAPAPGRGLGLKLVRSICAATGGDFTLTLSRVSAVARARLRWPEAAA